ncbi:MAG TPA: phosphoribosylglycinamide formyltransferase [Caldithrix abyssi]|uniref:Phosphoribosylglycinamide formyltransferase n=1 Tax=Caldithrix abyssi TaxID=187145 RepID=A0A7V5PN21_CALAY|nr:phosphoribosylglycinamide formyltransferase [Caldithrix abyssi]
MKKKIAIFISGRGSNMAAILKNCRDGILKDVCQPVLVFSNKPDAPGLETAKQFGVPTAVLESAGKKREAFDRQVLDLLQSYQPDYIVLAGYMRILSPLFIRAYRNRIINIHPADTAQFQGLGAYVWAWENGLQETKITVHFVDEGIDTGPVIGKETVDLRGAQSLEEVERRGLAVEHRFYSEMLRKVFTEQDK